MRYLGWPAVAVLVSVVLGGCGLFDSGTEWHEGRYALVWIDTPENVSVYRVLPDGNVMGRIDATVYAVGWNGRYLVAKQHPGGDRRKLYYFIIDVSADSDLAEPQRAVMGPLTESVYRAKSAELNLPAFSKVLESLQ